VNKLKIAYLSSCDPTDKKVWSGTHFSIFSTLNKHVGNVTQLGPYAPKFQIFVGKLLAGFSQLVFGKRYNYRHSHLLARSYARFFNRKLKEENFDFIIAPAAMCELAYIKTNVPIIYISDSTINLSINYHKALTGLSRISEKETREIERLTYANANKIIVSSNWAKESLIFDYRIPDSHVVDLPFGANMGLLPEKSEALNKAKVDCCRILFMGVYWESKGGSIAFNCLVELLKLGVNAELTICGCVPPEEFKHENMNVIPFINKNSKEGMKKLYDVFMQHDLLILPTRFDCTPIVICEASAFAMPCFVADTGGVRGHLNEGKNGYLIDYNDNGIGYARKIAEVFSNKEQFETLKKTTREEYDTRLNWENYGKKLKELVDSILSNG
jgi:glycosyltransferase involved in cell wall biosynthesis